MRIDIEDVYQAAGLIDDINCPELEDIVFFYKGEKVDIPKKVIDEWEFIGLNNSSFILDYEWPK